MRTRTADGALSEKALGVVPETTTPEVVQHLFEWATVTYMPAVA